MPWNVLRLAEEGRIVLCITPSMLDELNDVLNYERLQPRLEQLGFLPAELIAYVLNLATVFEVEMSDEDPIVMADPDDDIFLHCAVAASVVYVVSGDRHLLDLGTYSDVPILSVRDFLAQEFPALVID
jgi:putative PIN family toxin of toxin-antitoxin system